MKCSGPSRCLFIALVFGCAAAAPLQLSAQTISSTVDEMNGAVTPDDGQNQFLTPANPAELTIPTGYDFTAQNYQQFTEITFIEVTLTLQDGNSAPNDFDFNHLFLALDGVNTGIALNGFPGGGAEATLTISGNPGAAGATILTALQADGRLVGSIITDNLQDTAFPNELFVGNDAFTATTTLVIGVPEPATVALIASGLLMILAPQVRRWRRNF